MGDDSLQMSSQRPYLLRALYEWIADNGMTPHVLVNAAMPRVRVPLHAVKEGRIVLNIAERAVAKLELGNEVLRFTARFAGVSQTVSVPLEAVIAIYARETGQGMALPEELGAASTSAPAPGAAVTGPVAVESEARDANTFESDNNPHVAGEDAADKSGPELPSDPPKRGSHLRIVK
ncbi:MAG: ClpXP protease specificity-enhancing factor [Pseudomonadota bacterium]|nr:ClpXP protease specificity-enhancing factor [Pseudomonadota bacterium]MDQ3160367.1 ClpXP protease specificity-enhancing factor [Pseudomonadota bacterium]